MTVAPETLSMGLSEGDYCWMQTEQEPKDDLALARSPDRLSPRQILQSLIDCGYIRLKQHLVFAPEDEHTTDWQVFAQEQFPDWSKNDTERFAAAKEKMTKDDPTVITILGELVNPVFPTETREVMFIAAGGVEEGLVTARGVYQMRRAMEHAQEKGVPIVFFNAITSADPLFESEVGQISRQISETMALGLRLTVPKITVITGEAASAGAHAAWQIADRTLIFDRGALLTVIKVEEALNLLRFSPEITAGANRLLLEQLGLPLDNMDLPNLVQGMKVIEEVLAGREEAAQAVLEDEENLRAVVRLAKEEASQSQEKIMLIMPAENSRFVSGMLTRGADMITIHADDWQKRAEASQHLDKSEFLTQVKRAMEEAQEKKTRENTEVYFRIKADNFSGFWTIDDVRNILRELSSVGLTGIRFTEAATTAELQQLTQVMRQVETDLGLSSGAFKICLSVENDEAIENLTQVISDGDEDKRVEAVVMGVRDYTKSKAASGVADREWNHYLVSQAKSKLSAQISKLRETGWNSLQSLHAVASNINDYDSVHREAAISKALKAEGMLAVTPEQIPHIRASWEDIFSEDGSINKDRLEEILLAARLKIEALSLGRDARDIIYLYKRLFYQTYHKYRLALLAAGGAFPHELQKAGIADEIISADDNDLSRVLTMNLLRNITILSSRSSAEIRAERLAKLARLGEKTLRKADSIATSIRIEKAKGRGQRAAQYWLNLLTDGRGFDQEILTDLEPDPASDVLAKMGRTGARTYQGQIKEAQENTGTLSGIIAGYTEINGRNVLVITRDQDFINATAGASTGEMVRRACLDAVARKKSGELKDVAICYIDISAGGRVQEGALALAPSELAVAGLAEAQDAEIPVVNVGHTYILGSDGIGPFYCADKIVLIGTTTELGLAGRRIVERTSPLGKAEFPPGFRLAKYHKIVGNVTEVLERPGDLPEYLAQELSKI